MRLEHKLQYGNSKLPNCALPVSRTHKPPRSSAANHSTKNLPIVLAGGGFRHGQHLAFDPQSAPSLSNLYVTLLQRLGIASERFGSSTGTLTGLEMRG